MDITRDHLRAYLIEAVSEEQSSRVEEALRDSPELRAQLEELREEVGPSEHSIGSIWREQRLTCPNREELGGYLLNALGEEHRSYVEFHLTTVECPICLANLADLDARRTEDPDGVNERRRRIFEAVRGRLRKD